MKIVRNFGLISCVLSLFVLTSSARAAYGPPMGTLGYHWAGPPNNILMYIDSYPVIGFAGRAGTYVDSLSTYFATRWGSSGISLGGSSYGDRYSIWCPYGYVAAGLYGRSGTIVDQVGLICRKPGDSALSYTRTAGGSGGNYYEWVCPDGPGFKGTLTGLYEEVGVYYRLPDRQVVTAIWPFCADEAPRLPPGY